MRQFLNGLDLFVQHILLMLNWIEIWGIPRPNRQHQTLCFAHQTTLKPFSLCVRAHWPAYRGNRPLEHCCHQSVYVCNNATHHLPTLIPAWMAGPEVFRQIIAQRFTPFLLVCFSPIMHPHIMCSQRIWCTHGWLPSMKCKRKHCTNFHCSLVQI